MGRVDPWQASLQEVASAIIKMPKFSEAQARNAYSAVLLLPGYSQLRFVPLLTPFKREWNSNIEKYATFWNPVTIVKRLATTPLSWDNIVELRDRLIIVSRIFCLLRSVDLSRLLRTVSVVHGTPYMLVQRKGWKVHKWEQSISLPSVPAISPGHLIQKYVDLTSNYVSPGPLVNQPQKAIFSPYIEHGGQFDKKIVGQVWYTPRGMGCP